MSASRIVWKVEGDSIRWEYHDGGFLNAGVRLLSWRERLAWRLLRRPPWPGGEL